jgi:hypothetical protein
MHLRRRLTDRRVSELGRSTGRRQRLAGAGHWPPEVARRLSGLRQGRLSAGWASGVRRAARWRQRLAACSRQRPSELARRMSGLRQRWLTAGWTSGVWRAAAWRQRLAACSWQWPSKMARTPSWLCQAWLTRWRSTSGGSAGPGRQGLPFHPGQWLSKAVPRLPRLPRLHQGGLIGRRTSHPGRAASLREWLPANSRQRPSELARRLSR